MNITQCSSLICTGCSACLNICTKGAIKMKEDELGHQFPHIDAEKCVDCGLCEKICPALHPLEHNTSPEYVYALASKDAQERYTSSSGGASSIICRIIIKQGGVVYGCAQIGSLKNIKHIRIEDENDLKLLKGSKYTQSIIGETYKQVEDDLKGNKLVCFVGTPCQVAGLLSFLRKPYDNLLTLDLICHGVPSQKLLQENATQYKIGDLDDIFVDFRHKKGNNIRFGQYYYKSGDVTVKYIKAVNNPFDDYIAAFMMGLSFRECCHTCPYSSTSRMGDITIGDFWGLGTQEHTHFKIKDGVSLVIANNDKGLRLLKSILPQTDYEKRTFAEAAKGNGNLSSPSPRPLRKDIFLSAYKTRGLHAAVRKAIPRSRFYKLFLVEQVKQTPILVKAFKTVRLLKNKTCGRK